MQFAASGREGKPFSLARASSEENKEREEVEKGGGEHQLAKGPLARSPSFFQMLFARLFQCPNSTRRESGLGCSF